MKYSTAVIACTAILCASTTLAAPSTKQDSSSYLQRRGGAASKTAAEIAAEAKRMATSEAARRLAIKVAKEVATQQGQKALDNAKKDNDKRSLDDMELAVREYLEARGGAASKTAAEIAAEAKRMATSEAARRLAIKVAKEVATQQGQKALDNAKKDNDKRSLDDMELAVREYLEARGGAASKTAAEIAAEAKRMATSEAARRLAIKVAKEVATQQGQKALDNAKKDNDKRSLDDMEFAAREYLEARGGAASKTAAEIAAEAKRMATSEAARRLAIKVAKEVATQQGQKALDNAKKDNDKRSLDDKHAKRSLDDSELSRREFIADLMDVVERELEAREYGVFNDLD